MKYRTLGRTGLSVSEIGHGLWGMGDWSESDDVKSLSALQASLDAGCNFFDSAWAYGNGHSDNLLGKLAEIRPAAALIKAGKIPPKNWKWPASPQDKLNEVYPLDHVLEFAKKSLANSKSSCFELMQLHVWDDTWAADPLFPQIVNALKSNGLATHFGISLNRWEPTNGIKAIKTGLVDVVQVIYNIFDQAPEDELFPVCAEHHIGVIARVPLDEGSLGGKLTINTRFPPSDWRSKYFGPENLPQTIARVDALKKSMPPNQNLPDVALRFILQNPVISTVIVGMRTLEHVTANTAASGKPRLDAHLMVELRRHRWDRAVTPWAN